jgi:hypothetical protein
MPRRKRSFLSEVDYGAYKVSQAAGDMRAAQNGRLGRRLVRRSVTRTGFRILRAFLGGMR